MNQPSRKLYNYIETEIIRPLGINLEELYCTNLIKCYTENLSEETNKRDTMYINKIFNNCSKLLENEVMEIKPLLIISLSKRVFEILNNKYMDEKYKFTESFGKIHSLNINNNKIPYIPVVHIPKNNKVRERYFPEQRRRLKEQEIILK